MYGLSKALAAIVRALLHYFVDTKVAPRKGLVAAEPLPGVTFGG